MELKTAIIGVGMVGSALARYLKNPILYDPPKGLGEIEDVNKCDVIFICVPTPGECDLTVMENVIKEITGEKIIVIKSTVLPGTTDYFQKKYPYHKFLFNPEFLTEATADQDMKYPDRQIVGYTKESFTIAKDIMLMLPLAPFERIVPAKEAEMTKYYNNAWFATKVIFANQIYDICEKVGIDYDKVREMASADKRVGPSHLDVLHKGYRGFGGKCLPKDLDALLKFAKDNEVKVPLLEITKEINDTLRAV
jgi:UDPglucose 6-dehydrogenase